MYFSLGLRVGVAIAPEKSFDCLHYDKSRIWATAGLDKQSEIFYAEGNSGGTDLNLLLLGGAALAFLWWINNRPVVIGSQEFFRPDLVQHIAAGMPQDEDAFILAAWRYVAQSYIYEPIGSDMVFVNGQILCEDCYLPGESLDRDRGNCVAKSALLASILATRLSNERIHIIIGSFGLDRQMGGHAWVEVFRHGTWYLLEATAPPGPNPWVTADSKFPEYDPGVMITNGKVVCADEFYCASFASCNCLEVLRK